MEKRKKKHAAIGVPGARITEALAVASVLPSGEKATALTQPVWPFSVRASSAGAAPAGRASANKASERIPTTNRGKVGSPGRYADYRTPAGRMATREWMRSLPRQLGERPHQPGRVVAR